MTSSHLFWALIQRVVISLSVAGGRERHRARSGGTGTRADGEEGCPGGSHLLELCANSPHQSLSSLNALKGEEMECAVYRSNTHLTVPQDRLRHTRAGVRTNKLSLRGSKSIAILPNTHSSILVLKIRTRS